MFNYIKETIINSADAILSVDGQLAIKRAGNYDLSKIVGSVYKTAGVAGSVGKIEITVPALVAEPYRFTMFISTPSKSLSDFAMANWAEFGKPIMVEFAGSATAADAAKNLAEALKLVAMDSVPFSVSVSGAKVTITLAESWMVPEQPEIVKISDGSAVADSAYVVTKNVEEFATGKWLVENLRFPTYYNRRYAAPYADESPVDGQLYTQYSFNYKVERPGLGGLSAVGQAIESEVTIVFYVAPSAVSAFEGKLSGKISERKVSISGSTAITGKTTSQLKAIFDGEDVTTKATWTSSAAEKATVGAHTGLVTGVANGDTTITASYNGDSASVKVTVSGVS